MKFRLCQHQNQHDLDFRAYAGFAQPQLGPAVPATEISLAGVACWLSVWFDTTDAECRLRCRRVRAVRNRAVQTDRPADRPNQTFRPAPSPSKRERPLND